MICEDIENFAIALSRPHCDLHIKNLQMIHVPFLNRFCTSPHYGLINLSGNLMSAR